jgi:hypothetical protein
VGTVTRRRDAYNSVREGVRERHGRTMAKANRFSYTVAGYGVFPTDMLRYDACWPATQDDVERLDATRDDFGKPPGVIKPIVVGLVGVRYPTKARWESFGWRVDGPKRAWKENLYQDADRSIFDGGA